MREIGNSMCGIYCIKDKHAGMFLPPFLASGDDEAKRIVGDSVEPGSVLGRYPADFQLIRCGTFDAKCGIVRDPAENLPDVLCSVTDIIREDVIAKSLEMERQAQLKFQEVQNVECAE